MSVSKICIICNKPIHYANFPPWMKYEIRDAADACYSCVFAETIKKVREFERGQLVKDVAVKGDNK